MRQGVDESQRSALEFRAENALSKNRSADIPMSFLRTWVLNNWGLKLAALGISFLVWTTYTSEPIVEVSFQVPLEFRNIPPNLELLGDLPTHVRVRVRGRSALLRRLAPADFGIRVDLTGHGQSDALVPLTSEQVDAPYGASVMRVTPSHIRVHLVPRRASS